MKGQELKILFRNDMAFLSEVALDFTQVELPDSLANFKASAFWEIRVINLIQEKKLFVEVISYNVGETEFSNEQIELGEVLSSVENVVFKSIDTSGWLKTLHSRDPMKMFHVTQVPIYHREEQQAVIPKIENELLNQVYNTPFSVAIKDVLFLSGKVSFKKKIQELNRSIVFEIKNESICKEYDAIKNYFAKILKTNKIKVAPTITIIDGKITSIVAISDEIEKIDNSFIEEVKFQIVKAASKKEYNQDKKLFTVYEYLDTFIHDAVDAQHFFKDEKDFFEHLVKNSQTKHHFHLRFLSSRHMTDLMKLRIVHRPLSFIFLLSNATRFYIIWETLDTEEATYIWTFPNNNKSIGKILLETEKIIQEIVRNGRIEYIARNEMNFVRLIHDYNDSQMGFKKWKAEIEELISTETHT